MSKVVTLASSASSEISRQELTWRQALILRAAIQGNGISYRQKFVDAPGEIPYGVFRSLAQRGLLRHSRDADFEITAEGRLALSAYEYETQRRRRSIWKAFA